MAATPESCSSRNRSDSLSTSATISLYSLEAVFGSAQLSPENALVWLKHVLSAD